MKILAQTVGARSGYFGGPPRAFRQMKVDIDGATLSLSQYATEFPDWGVDTFIRANGMPHWVHGEGERDGIIVQAVNEEIAHELNAAWPEQTVVCGDCGRPVEWDQHIKAQVVSH